MTCEREGTAAQPHPHRGASAARLSARQIAIKAPTASNSHTAEGIGCARLYHLSLENLDYFSSEPLP